MCEYVENNNCRITQKCCPYMYFCYKSNSWKPSKAMPVDCKIKKMAKIPEGYCYVRMERKGYLYVDIDGYTYKILNPFTEVPLYVKATKLKNGKWRLKKYEG